MLLLAGWVDANQAVGHVNWGLLLLIGSALGFSKAIANSGLAAFAGRAVRESGMSPSASLYALFGLTMVRHASVGVGGCFLRVCLSQRLDKYEWVYFVVCSNVWRARCCYYGTRCT